MKEINKDIDLKGIALLLKIGILGAFIILAGDIIMGWGVKDTSLTGIEGQLSQYLTISDKRMILASVFGFSGVPLAVAGHYGIYKLIKPYSEKYAKLYGIGNLGFLAFGGAGMHGASVEAAFFYKCMKEADVNTALDSTVKFALYFLLPLYIIVISCWIIMIYAHIRAVWGGLSPLPRIALLFSMPVGSLLCSFVGLFGNHEIVNALMVGAFSIGNIWSLAGHLFILKKNKEQIIIIGSVN